MNPWRIGLSGAALLGVIGCSGAAERTCPTATSGDESAAASSATVEEDIRELLVLTNAVGNAQQMMQPIVVALSQAYPAVPATLWTELMQGMSGDEFASMMIDIYERNYARDEIAAMLAFYRSEVGRSIVKKAPTVIAEGQRAGAIWGEQLTLKLIEGARSRGFEI